MIQNPYNEDTPQDLIVTFDRGVPRKFAAAVFEWLMKENIPGEGYEADPIYENQRVHIFNEATTQAVRAEYPDTTLEEAATQSDVIGAWHCDDSFAWSAFIYAAPQPDGTFTFHTPDES